MDARIEAILDWATEHPEFDTDFVESVKAAYEDWGRLTERQSDALDNIINKFRIDHYE